VGYFIGELDAIARQPKARYMLGFMFDANHCSTKVFELNMKSEDMDLQQRFKIKGRIADFGLNRIVITNDSHIYMMSIETE
jgi:hypothetical protein